MLPNNPPFHYTAQSPFMLWVQKVLPLAFDDALSYYESIAKMRDKLNETIQRMNETGEAVESLSQAYTDLSAYVQEYFNELDLQPLINDGVNNSLANGQLQPVVSASLAQFYNPKFVDNLSDMVDRNLAFVLQSTNSDNSVLSQVYIYDSASDEAALGGGSDPLDMPNSSEPLDFAPHYSYSGYDFGGIVSSVSDMSGPLLMFVLSSDNCFYQYNPPQQTFTKTDYSFGGVVPSVSHMAPVNYIYVLTSNYHVYAWDGNKFADTGVVYGAVPSDENFQAIINEWLDNHPESTTTVQDGSITSVKLADSLSCVINNKRDKFNRPLNIILISDIHLTPTYRYGLTPTERINLLTKSLIQENNTRPVDALFVLGDLTTVNAFNVGDNTNYLQILFDSCFSKLPFPVYALPGNHDGFTDDEWLNTCGNKRQFSVVIENTEIVFLCLDNFNIPVGDSASDVETDELYKSPDTAFIQNMLDLYPDKYFILTAHFFKPASDSQTFKNILNNPNILALICGHTHTFQSLYYNTGFRNVPMIYDGNFSYNLNNPVDYEPNQLNYGYTRLYSDNKKLNAQYVQVAATYYNPDNSPVPVPYSLSSPAVLYSDFPYQQSADFSTIKDAPSRYSPDPFPYNSSFTLSQSIMIRPFSDLNNLKSPGTYMSPNNTVSVTLLNCPLTQSSFRLIVMTSSGTIGTSDANKHLVQIIIPNYTCGGIFMRWFKTDTLWSPWSYSASNSYSLDGALQSVNEYDNLDNFTSYGSFICRTKEIAATLTNCPYPDSGFKLVVERVNASLYDTDYLRQTLYNNTNNIFVRNKTNGVWSDWDSVTFNSSFNKAVADSYSLSGSPYSILEYNDLNNFTSYGTFVCATKEIAATLTNSPTSVSGFKLIVERVDSYNGDTDYLLQTVKSNVPEMFVRKRTASIWSPWEKIALNSDLTSAMSLTPSLSPDASHSLPANTDLNSIVTFGSYISPSASISATIFNSPDTSRGFSLTVFRTSASPSSNSFISQIFINTVPSIWIRSLDTNIWSEWHLVQLQSSSSYTFDGSNSYIIPTNANLNDYTSYGSYISQSTAITNSLKNCPHTGSGLRLTVQRSTNGTDTSSYVQQIILTGNSQMYIRNKNAGNWGHWFKVNTTDTTT